MHIGVWDVALLLATTLQVAVVAYLYHPRWKALAGTLPVPFTLAMLNLGRPIDATNVIGLALLLLFTQSVRVLHNTVKIPIVVSIAVTVLAYCAIGAWLAPRVARDDFTFYSLAAALFFASIIMLIVMPVPKEPGHRTPLPVYVKAPGVGAIVVGVLLLKGILRSFIPTFPMVTSFAAYELRHALRTFCRQVPLVMLAMVPMMAVCRATQTHVGLARALGLGWLIFLAILIPVMYQAGRPPYAAPAIATPPLDEVVPPAPAGS